MSHVYSPVTNPSSSMVQKLILLVLTGILGCLIVIIAQHRTPKESDQTSEAALDESPAIETPAPEPVADPAPQRVRAPSRPIPTTGRQSIRPRPVTASRSQGVSQKATVSYPSLSQAAAANDFSQADPTLLVTGGDVGNENDGSISGRVRFTGAPPPEVPIAMDAVCGKFYTRAITPRHYVISEQGGLANVLVYIQSGLEDKKWAPPADVPSIDQTGCLFEPYVSGLLAGQKFKIRNLDSFMHNVHATPKSNQEFNFAQALQGQTNEKSFPKPELMIRIKCDVHPWMFSYINVMPHPYFAITDKEGVYRLPAGLPPGRYTVT